MSTDKLYRYINFFDLYNLLENKLLRVPQATGLDDDNEGFGFVLRQLDSNNLPIFRYPYGPDGPRIIKTLSYISCWTTEHSEMVMWLLYSKNSEGFRIQTTWKKLDSVLMDYRKSYATSPDRIKDFCPREDDYIFGVTYKNFREIKEELQKRNKEHRMTMSALPDTMPKVDKLRALSEAARKIMETLEFRNNPWSYKDEAYGHENEVGAVIEFEASSEEGHSLVSGGEDLIYLTNMFPSCTQMAICDDFIEDICIDERCDHFKKSVYRSFLLKYGYSLSESQVFNSLFDVPGRLDP